jgi:SAM-dependent methyltransferase
MVQVDPSELENAVTVTARTGTDRGARHVRRSRGQVFTPEPLARLVCREVLSPLGGGPLRVLDPACGDGRFLAAAAELLGGGGGGRRRRPPHRLIGIERDAALAAACRTRVPEAEVHVAETLFGAPEGVGLGELDAVIGNPPYVRSIRLREDDPAMWRRVRGAFAATSHGEWDLYGAFVEASLGWVRPGGRVGLIVPSRWLTARWAARLRGVLARSAAVRCVVDFGAAQVFPDATTYASVLILEKPRASPVPVPVPVPVLRRAAAGWERGTLDTAALGERSWVMEDVAGGEAGTGTGTGAGSGLTLGDVARIAKGTGTNADGVFILDDAVVDGRWVHGRDGDGDDVTVELAATRSCWRGRDVQPDGRPRARCIVPYDEDGALISFAALRRRWPRAAAHLTAHRARLEGRERGRFAGDAFHVFGRPQNLRFHLDPAPKVIVPDVARTARAILDASGALVLDTAYALRPRPDAPAPWRDARALHALCASPLVLAWLARAGVPLRGDYRRLKTAFLAPMPLPARPPA